MQPTSDGIDRTAAAAGGVPPPPRHGSGLTKPTEAEFRFLRLRTLLPAIKTISKCTRRLRLREVVKTRTALRRQLWRRLPRGVAAGGDKAKRFAFDSATRARMPPSPAGNQVIHVQVAHSPVVHGVRVDLVSIASQAQSRRLACGRRVRHVGFCWRRGLVLAAPARVDPGGGGRAPPRLRTPSPLSPRWRGRPLSSGGFNVTHRGPLLPHRRQLHVATPGDRLANTCGSREAAGARWRWVRWSGLDDAILRQHAGLPPPPALLALPTTGPRGLRSNRQHRRAARVRSPAAAAATWTSTGWARRGSFSSLLRRSVLWDALRLKDGGTRASGGKVAEGAR